MRNIIIPVEYTNQKYLIENACNVMQISSSLTSFATVRVQQLLTINYILKNQQRYIIALVVEQKQKPTTENIVQMLAIKQADQKIYPRAGRIA